MFSIAVNQQSAHRATLSIESDDVEGRELIAKMREQVCSFVAEGTIDNAKNGVLQTRLNADEIAKIVQFLPSKIIMAIKECRLITGLGLKEAKQFVDYIIANTCLKENKANFISLESTNAALQRELNNCRDKIFSYTEKNRELKNKIESLRSVIREKQPDWKDKEEKELKDIESNDIHLAPPCW